MTASLGLRILCVDDDDEIRELLGELFRGEGYDVTLAASAAEALAKLEGGAFHLVITDYRLPDQTGAWMLREAEARGYLRGAEAIIITAGPAPLDAGSHRVFRKPLDVDDFLARVEMLLAPARSAELDRARHALSASAQPALTSWGTRRVEFVLYISSASHSSLKALRNMQRLLGAYEPSQVLFKVCDLSRELPPSAEEDRIAFTPTLIKRYPEPITWILGDLDDIQVVDDLMAIAGVEKRK